MVDFNAWLNTSSPVDESFYASRAWKLIQRNPVELAFKRGATLLDAQTVRVTFSNEEQQIEGRSGAQASRRDVIIFGVRNHPTVADTDIKRGDQFEYLGRLFKVTDVIKVLGSIQAETDAME